MQSKRASADEVDMKGSKKRRFNFNMPASKNEVNPKTSSSKVTEETEDDESKKSSPAKGKQVAAGERSTRSKS